MEGKPHLRHGLYFLDLIDKYCNLIGLFLSRVRKNTKYLYILCNVQ